MPQQWPPELRRVNLNQLVSFAAVAQQQSFRRAAEQLHVSQSALSVHVQHIEAALGVKLFVRDTRSMALTPEGERLYGAVDVAGNTLARVIRQLKDEAALRAGSVSVAVLPSLAATFMPQAMRRFRERHPGIEVRMCDVDSQRAHEKLVNAEVDIAVVSRRERSEGVDFTALFEDELVVVVPDALPELAGRKTLAPKQLAAYPLLLNPRGVDLREIIEERFRSAGLAVEPAQELTGTYPLVSLVRLGLGVSIQPRVALHGVSLEGCRLVEFRPATVREIGLLLLKDAPHSPATLAFMECLKAMDAADLSRPAPRKARRGVLSDTAKALSMK